MTGSFGNPISWSILATPTVASRQYKRKSRDDLGTGNWQPLSGGAGRVTGTGGEWTVMEILRWATGHVPLTEW